ncbi:TPA: hypothetical protein JG946_003747 [Enterobacter hormaechei subsp. steigerwaltii]|nr:hypothetical protein [Enterobacter hormaechei subsp. steigerwaltii]
MSTIKTITATLISRVLADDFHTAYLVADGERRVELASVDPDEVQDLITRLEEALPVIREVREQRRVEALEALKSVIGGTGFTSVDELLAAAGGGTVQAAPVKAKATSKSKSSNSNNKSFTVSWNEESPTEPNKQIRKEFTIVNFDTEKKPISKESFFIAQMKKLKGNLHEFMLMYSEDYSKHCANEYKGKQFYISSSLRGSLNQYAQPAYDEWLADQKKAGVSFDGMEARDIKSKFYNDTLKK